MALICPNNLESCTSSSRLCKLLGIRFVTSPAIVQLAARAGFDALFIELEHSVLDERDASVLCTTALLSKITPFVRVPYQCGDGFVQRILDCGAMGIIFPHVSCAEDARKAVAICKYPPVGKRSMTALLPQFGMVPTPAKTVIEELNANGSTVVAMIETSSAVDDVEAIAAVPGVDVLLVGTNDLSIELCVPGEFESETFRRALHTVSDACKKEQKVLGLAGIYDNEQLQRWAVHELRVSFMLCQLDSGLLAKGMKSCMEAVEQVELK